MKEDSHSSHHQGHNHHGMEDNFHFDMGSQDMHKYKHTGHHNHHDHHAQMVADFQKRFE